jgi:hypothetical protein
MAQVWTSSAGRALHILQTHIYSIYRKLTRNVHLTNHQLIYRILCRRPSCSSASTHHGARSHYAARTCAQRGRGLLVPDIPLEETGLVREAIQRSGLGSPLLTTTTGRPVPCFLCFCCFFAHACTSLGRWGLRPQLPSPPRAAPAIPTAGTWPKTISGLQDIVLEYHTNCWGHVARKESFSM